MEYRCDNRLDPKLFRSETLSADARKVIDQTENAYPSMIPQTPEQLQQVRDKMRENANPGKRVSARATWRSVPGPRGPVRLRILRAKNPRGIMIYLHGGGWCAGSADMQDGVMEGYCERLHLTVVSIDYRLAPEHPYPVAPDDCEGAFRWIVENCRKEFQTSRLLVLGESAGAHLAVVTVLRMRDHHDFTDFRGLCLAYGLYDLSGVPSHTRFDNHNLALNSALIDWFIDQFVPQTLRRNPDVSPLYADLSRLPPALITVGTHDPLLDQSLFLYVRWVAAANQAALAVCPGGLHGFLLLEPTPESRNIQAEMDRFMAGRLR